MKIFQRRRGKNAGATTEKVVGEGTAVIGVSSEKSNVRYATEPRTTKALAKANGTTSSSSSVREGERMQRQTSDTLKRHAAATTSSERELSSSSFYSPSRIRFDSLVARQGTATATSSTAQSSTSASGGGRPRKGGKTSKHDVALPDDLRMIPRLRSKETTKIKDNEPPLFVVGNGSGSEHVARPISDGEVSAQKGDDKEEVRAAPSADAFKVPTSPASVLQQASQTSSFTNGAQSQAREQLRLRRDAPKRTTAFAITDMRSPNLNGSVALSPPPFDIGQPSPSLTASPISPEGGFDVSSPPNRDEWDEPSQLTRRTSILSLRRGRLSGLFGTWNRSASGLLSDHKLKSSVHEDDAGIVGVPATLSSAPSRSQALANELNELAVAFEEGLLGQDEYRMLRKGVFDKMMGQGEMEVPKEATLRASQTSPAELSSRRTDDGQSYSASTRSKQSGRGKLSGSLFRDRSQRSNPHTPSSAFRSSDRSMMSNGTGSIAGSRSEKQGQLALQENYSQARKARTLRGVASLNSIEPPSAHHNGGDAHSRNGVVSSGRSAVTGFSVGGLSISSGSALLGRDYADKSSQEIAAEIAVVEAEGRRIVENFKTLEVQAIGRHKLTFEQIRRAVDGVEDEAHGGSPTDVREGFVFLPSHDSSRIHPPRSSDNHKTRMSGLLGKSRNLSSSVVEASRNSKLNYPPSSFRTRPSTTTIARRREDDDAASKQEVSASSVQSNDDGVLTLRKELIDVHRRKAEVAKKYDDRVAFLRSAMRSAKIRETLR